MKLGRGLCLGLLVAAVAAVAILAPMQAVSATDPLDSRLAGVYLSHTGHDGPYMSLSLGEDGTATLTEDPGTGAIVRFAHWTDPGGEVTIRFDPEDGKPAPAPMIFRVDHDELQATSWNHGFWGRVTPPAIKRSGGVKETYWFTTVR